MIETLLGSAVEAVELRAGEPVDPLLAEERAGLGAALARRERDHRAGRHCARRALARLGVASVPILGGDDRAPVWPEGIVGSITHCEGYAAAAVARAADVAALGIDAEPHAPLPPGVLRRVTGAGDQLPAPGGPVHWDRLLFSAKESVFKAWSPLAGRGLGFGDARVTFAADAGRFRAEILVPADAGGPSVVEGRFAVHDGLVLTAVVVPRARQ